MTVSENLNIQNSLEAQEKGKRKKDERHTDDEMLTEVTY